MAELLLGDGFNILQQFCSGLVFIVELTIGNDLVGARLAANEHNVWLLHHRPEYVEQLSEHGVRIQGDYHSDTLEVNVPATTTADDIGPVDLVLVLVKAHHTKTAVRMRSG